MSERVLVTGAAGFAGGHLLALLASEQPAPAVVGWRRPAPDGVRPPEAGRGRDSRIVWQEVDILDRAAVERAVAQVQPRQVYHLAGAAAVAGSWTHCAATLRTNTLGTEHILAAVKRSAPAARVLIPGSALVYRPHDGALDENGPIGPVSPYGVSKLAQEMLAARYAADGLTVIRTRSFTHCGPGQDPSYAASSFARQVAGIEAGDIEPTLRVGDLSARRDLLDVRDTVRAYRALMRRGFPGAVYNVCSGSAHGMRDVLDELLAQARVPVDVQVDPERLRPSDYALLLGDRGRLTAATGWEPRIGLAETLRDLLADWRARLG
jgi:GDP-4-dehydro-6-deoxy-D-mannose reductase